MWNLVPDIKREINAEGVWEQGAEKNIWTKEKWTEGRVEKIA
jgi:hypothetical protein